MKVAKKLLLYLLSGLLLLVAAFDIWGFFTLGTIVPATEPVRDVNANRVVMVFGATGSVGDGLRKAAMEDPDGEKIHVITRRSSPRIEAGVAAGRVYVDPQSGRVLSSPPPGGPVQALSAKEQRMISRSHAGLYEEVLPNGAIRLNLQGRFRNLAVVSIDDTTRHMSCVGDAAVIDPSVAKPEHRRGMTDE